jgi:hypothetical protein
MAVEVFLRPIVLWVAAALGSGAGQGPVTVYAPLWSYQGAWHVTRANSAPGAKPDQLLNQCALLGKYFTCSQVVNGKPSELLIFVPTDRPGHYYTQTVNPDCRAGGRGELEISGDHWIFSSTWDQGGRTTYYRTTNVFTGKDKIHFEQAESPDGKDYKVTASGDEVKVGPGKTNAPLR